MGVRHLSWLAYGLASALLTQVCSAHVLDPIDMLEYEEGHIGARDRDYSKMDLRNVETFLWGGKFITVHLHTTQKLTGITHRSQCKGQIRTRKLHNLYAWKAREHNRHGEVLPSVEVN